MKSITGTFNKVHHGSYFTLEINVDWRHLGNCDS